jgi:dTDP-glucose 4,6-dehydratase
MRNILVTGGAGFIGTNFARLCLAHRPEVQVVVYDAITYAGCIASLEDLLSNPSFAFVHGDIRNDALVRQVLTSYNIDTIVHFAAESHVDRSIDGPDIFLDTNVQGTHVLLKASRDIWETRPADTVRFHHVSTDEVYGSLGPHDPAFHELTPYAPNSPYAASKAASDHLVRAYHHTYGLPVTTTNCSNNYGPYHFPEKLIPLALTRALLGQVIPLYGDGKNIRDWLYVEDHCRGILRVLEDGHVGETYNIGGHNEWSNRDVLELLTGLIDEAFVTEPGLAAHFPKCPAAAGKGTSSLITPVTDRLGHDRRYAIDASKIRTQLGFCPEESFASGIRKTVHWYLTHEAWWRPLLRHSEC